MERILAGAHEFREQRLLATLRSGTVPLAAFIQVGTRPEIDLADRRGCMHADHGEHQRSE